MIFWIWRILWLNSMFYKIVYDSLVLMIVCFTTFDCFLYFVAYNSLLFVWLFTTLYHIFILIFYKKFLPNKFLFVNNFLVVSKFSFRQEKKYYSWILTKSFFSLIDPNKMNCYLVNHYSCWWYQTRLKRKLLQR